MACSACEKLRVQAVESGKIGFMPCEACQHEGKTSQWTGHAYDVTEADRELAGIVFEEASIPDVIGNCHGDEQLFESLIECYGAHLAARARTRAELAEG